MYVCMSVNRRYTKGVPFLSKMACKRIGVAKVVRPSSYNTLLSAPPSPLGYHYVPQREAVCSSLLLFIVTFYAVSFSTFTSSNISHVTRHVSALDQLKLSCTINQSGSFFPEHAGERESGQFPEEFANFKQFLKVWQSWADSIFSPSV